MSLLSRRRSASKERQQTADERLDELLAQQTPARRTQSAEPSAGRPALVKSTRQTAAEKTPAGARTDPRMAITDGGQPQLDPPLGTMLAGLLPPLPGGALLGGGGDGAVDVAQAQLREQIPGWPMLQGPYPQGYPAVFHPGVPLVSCPFSHKGWNYLLLIENANVGDFSSSSWSST